MKQRLAKDSGTPDRYGGGGNSDRNKTGSMVRVPARGKAVTMGRHGRRQEGLGAEIKWRRGAGSGIQTAMELTPMPLETSLEIFNKSKII